MCGRALRTCASIRVRYIVFWTSIGVVAITGRVTFAIFI